MAYDDPTANYSWDLPFPTGDTNVWGTMLNEIFGNATTGIDAVIKAVSDVADAAMPLAGGTFTGNVEFGSGCAARENLISISSSVNWGSGNFFTKSLPTGVTDWQTGVFTGYPPVNTVQFITIHLVQPGAGGATVTWPNEVEWQDGTAPTLAASGGAIDVLVFYTIGDGTSTPRVFGAHSITNPS